MSSRHIKNIIKLIIGFICFIYAVASLWTNWHFWLFALGMVIFYSMDGGHEIDTSDFDDDDDEEFN